MQQPVYIPNVHLIPIYRNAIVTLRFDYSLHTYQVDPRLILYANTGRLTSVVTLAVVLVKKCVAPIQ